MKFIDLFGGIGGFRLGLKQAHPDWECVWYCDNDKYAVEVYNENFNEKYKPTDIREVDARDVPDHDVLCAGFPCQPFSVFVKDRKGFSDTRGTMFFEICRIAKEKQPKILFLENIKGLLNHEDGKTFRVVLQMLDELGYDVEWRVLNSKHFGVPQSRNRVYIIGHRRPEQTKLSLLEQELYTDGKTRIIGMLNIKALDACRRIYSMNGISPTLSTGQGGYRVPKLLDNNGVRYFTPLEQERLQGFPDEYTSRAKKAKRYKQTGNAVTVSVIKAIGELL